MWNPKKAWENSPVVFCMGLVIASFLAGYLTHKELGGFGSSSETQAPRRIIDFAFAKPFTAESDSLIMATFRIEGHYTGKFIATITGRDGIPRQTEAALNPQGLTGQTQLNFLVAKGETWQITDSEPTYRQRVSPAVFRSPAPK